MKKIFIIFILSFNFIFAENTANIASFNVLHLGWNNKKDYKTLSEIISLFDITGLVEVTNEKGLKTGAVIVEDNTEILGVNIGHNV